MKFPYLVLTYCLLAITPTCFSQEWILRNPLPTNANLKDVYMINPDTGFVCGDYQTILKTIDGGQTWHIKGLPANNILYGIAFNTRDTGFAVGWEGSILRTDDYGETWEIMPQPFPANPTDLRDIFFLDSQHGWICGWYHSILRTLDGGVNWEVLCHNIAIDHNYQIVKFLTPDTGYVAGMKGFYEDGKLKKTINGGLTWSEIQIPAEIPSIYSLEIIDTQEFWIASDHQIGSPNGAATRIYHTVDGGLSWTSTDLLYYGPRAQSIKFFNTQHGVVSCEYRIFGTNDGGITWNEHLVSYDKPQLINTHWVNKSYGLSVGYNGYIFKSEDVGLTWNEVSQGTKSNFSDIFFTDNQSGYAVGYKRRYIGGSQSTLFRTHDGGETWVNIKIPVDTNVIVTQLKSIMFSDANNGWAVGSDGLMLQSIDAGQTWETVSSGVSLWFYTVELFTDKFIWAGCFQRLIRSSDFGNTWQEISLPYDGYICKQIDFLDSLNGYLILQYNYDIHKGLMLKTTNGGLTLLPVEYVNNQTKRVLSMSFVDTETGYISIENEGLAKTVDGGMIWQGIGMIGGVVPSYLKFTSAEQGLAVKGDHFVAYTQDGGETWDILLNTMSNAERIQDYFFIDLNQGWLAGDGGLIKSFSPAGVDIPDLNPAARSGPIVYPNPVNDIMSIIFNETISRIRIYNAKGQILKNIQGSKLKTINISDLPAGLYILNCTDNRGEFFVKFIRR